MQEIFRSFSLHQYLNAGTSRLTGPDSDFTGKAVNFLIKYISGLPEICCGRFPPLHRVRFWERESKKIQEIFL